MVDSTSPAFETDSPADPHGRAALVLVDSLIHALVEEGTLTGEQAIEVVHDAATVQAETDYREQDAERLHDSLAMLEQIAASLQTVSIKPSLA